MALTICQMTLFQSHDIISLRQLIFKGYRMLNLTLNDLKYSVLLVYVIQFIFSLLYESGSCYNQGHFKVNLGCDKLYCKCTVIIACITSLLTDAYFILSDFLYIFRFSFV